MLEEESATGVTPLANVRRLPARWAGQFRIGPGHPSGSFFDGTLPTGKLIPAAHRFVGDRVYDRVKLPAEAGMVIDTPLARPAVGEQNGKALTTIKSFDTVQSVPLVSAP